ncbi:MAG: sulfite exporter TauE/SafE family protein [Acidobacteriota bacterium]
MTFPISGVEVHPLIPPLVAFVVATCTAPAGVSGAFLLLPFQVSVLGFTSPAVSPTNLIYNIVAIPGGLYRYIRDRRMAWPLTWVVILGTVPGVFVGGLLRVRYFLDPRIFKLFVGLVLLYLGGRLLRETTGRYLARKGEMKAVEKKFQEHVERIKQATGSGLSAGLPPEAIVKTRSWSLKRIEYSFWGEVFSFPTMTIFGLSLAVGLVGGIYGIGGGAIIAPFVVSVLGLPIYTVAGAALAGTFLTSIVGVAFFYGLSATSVGAAANVTPDWMLGALFGVGGLLGTYCGARLQRYLPERLIRGVLGLLVTSLAATYIVQFFR